MRFNEFETWTPTNPLDDSKRSIKINTHNCKGDINETWLNTGDIITMKHCETKEMIKYRFDGIRFTRLKLSLWDKIVGIFT